MQKVQLHTKYLKYTKGFSLVEIIVAVAVFLMFVTAIINLNVNTDRQLKRVVNSERATQLAEEGLEAVRNIRDEDFSNLSDGTYGLVASSSQWSLSGSSDVIDARTLIGGGIIPPAEISSTDVFTRQITVSTINANQKKIDSTVSWKDILSLDNSVTLSTYVTNWRQYNAVSGLSLRKVIINYFSTKGVLDFADYKATEVGTTTSYIFSATSTTESPANTFTFQALDLSSGSYTVSETVDPNYTQTFSDDCDVAGVVTLAPGDSKVCTITNEEKYATLTVVKNVVNSGGTKTVTDFSPFKYDATDIVQGSPTKIPPGSYTISETVDPDYTQTFTGDCNASGLITLAIGNTKTCTITNTQLSWLNPNTQLSTLDLAGTNDGRKIQVQGTYAYVVRAGGTPTFAIINISNPVTPTLTGSLTLTGNPANIFVSGNYAYIASDSDASELQIIDISNPAAPTLAGTFNAAGNGNANHVVVVGTTVYMGRVNGGVSGDFLTINISNLAAPTLIAGINTGFTTFEIVVLGNYAYAASGDNTNELKIIDITNPAAPTVVGGYNAASNNDGSHVALSGNTVFLSQTTILYKINLPTPTTTALLGSYNAGGTINDISLWLTDLTYVFLATAKTTAELQIINGTPNTPVLYGDFNGVATYNGVAYDSNTNRAYIAGTSDVGELTVVRP